MKNLILTLNTSNSLQHSLEGVKIRKFVSSISPSTFITLLKYADNKVNPRTATVNKITKSIHETLETSPDLFWYKSKGILVSTEHCDILDQNKLRITLKNLDYEGIMDGGHNTFAIATYLIEKLFNEKLKKWDECKSFWKDHFEEIENKLNENIDKFKFSIPIEIITPTEEKGAIYDFYNYISEICSARNNNVQLKETAKGNQIGCYDYLKSTLNEELGITWKTGSPGKIKSEDVISLASLPLIFLNDNKLLPKEIKTLNRISIYSQKGKCIDFFNEVISNKSISHEEKGKYITTNNKIKSALELTKDILEFFDTLYVKFPDLYHHAAPGKFGKISSVENKKKSKTPFGTTDKLCDYNYSLGFIYPLISGITSLMKYDKIDDKVIWKINPNKINLMQLDLSQYVELVKMVNFDPQKIGKGMAFYTEAQNIFVNANS